MKRKSCLIEVSENIEDSLNHKLLKASLSESCLKMFKNTIWYRYLQNAEKTCIKDDQLKKIHYKFDDDREMVEEYNVDTTVLTRRAWKVKGKLGGEGRWEVEVGDPIPDAVAGFDLSDFRESKDQPTIVRRNTRINLEWRIRNLPYPIETYSISADNDEKCIIVRTSNKKYFKKLQVPELLRLNLPLQQANIYCSHQHNTLIIKYKKPLQLIDMDKQWYEELKTVKPVKDVPNDCKAQ